MVMSTARFNLVDPTQDPKSLAARYGAMLEMASYCDTNGFLGFSYTFVRVGHIPLDDFD